ncbi:hypothetical protein HYPSUDRAFT_198742 [Hypholoma sublateritium FD-334 SS-4]|uniref:Uncharacterized protein n=1 Tax=Hypholoma sublateritium (strain FD-334 SS-4) TaxID=945553 RepID=A0A0D2LH66_HYPSF|nr:hypothetical protein HYPSUDRAFT_198742 [Hypholoma sublateritium FD-334 SS-4]
MQHQFRTRGIYRANAQRLSISLAPLVAQRSLLFRVKADLSTRTNYGQLTPTTDESDIASPGLFALTASARVRSALLTAASALSAASVYSQDSWQGPHSPSIPRTSEGPAMGDTRRHAIAFSPSVQLADLLDAVPSDSAVRESQLFDVPLTAASAAAAAGVPPEAPTTLTAMRGTLAPLLQLPAAMHVAMPRAANLNAMMPAMDGGKLKKKREDLAPRSAKASTFSKVISRISLQPSKREVAAAERRQTTAAVSHQLPALSLADFKPMERLIDYKLPALKTPGPIRMSFIVAPMVPVSVLPPPKAIAAPNGEATELVHATQRIRTLRATMPPAPARAPAPEAAPTRGHRRYRSSPAALQFDFKSWEAGAMPPLPAMPTTFAAPLKIAPAPPPRSGLRARAQSTAGRTPPATMRGVAPPFPAPRFRNASF